MFFNHLNELIWSDPDSNSIGELPLVAYINCTNPMCVYEFEPYMDSILVGFDVSMNASLEIISGRYEPNGLLPFQMPANMLTVEKQYEDVPFDMECHVDTKGNVYDYVFGMNWSGVIRDRRVATYGR